MGSADQTATSLTTAPSDEEMQYMNDMIKDMEITDTVKCVFLGETKGKGIESLVKATPGDVLWKETPFVAMQDEENREYISACSHCMKSIGALHEQLQLLVDSFGPEDDEETVLKVPQLGHTSNPSIECQNKCSKVQYCSIKCRDDAWNAHHHLLCTSTNTAWDNYELHCQLTNQIFLLAGKLIVELVTEYIRNLNLYETTRPVDIFCKLPWWDVVSNVEELEEGQSLEEYCSVFRQLVQDTVDLLQEIIAAGLELSSLSPKLIDRIMNDCADTILSVDFFANVVGMFELNNIGISIPHQLGTTLPSLESDDLELISPSLQYLARSLTSSDDKEELVFPAEKFPALEGTALFSIICTMNHSCLPNVQVSYKDNNSIATVTALREILPGDELCIAYIETDQDTEERQEDLMHYQFLCDCEKCKEN